MAMNREQRRLLEKRGEVDAEGEVVAKKREPSQRGPKPAEERTSPVEFVKEVRGELRKVAWPSREEVIPVSYTHLTLPTTPYV